MHLPELYSPHNSTSMAPGSYSTVLPALVFFSLIFGACGDATGTTPTGTGQVSVNAELAPDSMVSPGKQYIPLLGVHIPILDNCELVVRESDVLYLKADGTLLYSVNWETAPEALFQRFVNGIAVGDKMVRSNGQIEDWGSNRTAFATFFGDPNTGVAEEYRLNVWEAGHAKGSFCVTAYFTEATEANIAAIKARVLVLMDGVEHLSQGEVESANAAAQQQQKSGMDARREAISTRKRDADEASLRQALTGLALVKLGTVSSSSSFGSSSLTSLERFQLCPSGQGIWTYGTDMVIQAERVNNQGDVSDVGSATSTTDNRAVGTWDVERFQGGLVLVIYTYDGQEKSWNLQPGNDEWSYLIGGRVFQVSKAGGLYGPECR